MNRGDALIYGTLLALGIVAAIVLGVGFAVAVYHILGLL